MKEKFRPKITLFCCVNVLNNGDFTNFASAENLQIKTVKMACSGMVKDVYLLRPFEANADAVMVIVCPENCCCHAEGSRRARKRVDWVKGLMNQIGIDNKRLSVYNIKSGDISAVNQALKTCTRELAELGPAFS